MENANKGSGKSLLARIDWLSWSGIVMIIGSYFLNVGGYIDANSWIYLWMNAIGGLLYLIWGYRKKAYAVVSANFVWTLIAAYHMFTKLK